MHSWISVNFAGIILRSSALRYQFIPGTKRGGRHGTVPPADKNAFFTPRVPTSLAQPTSTTCHPTPSTTAPTSQAVHLKAASHKLTTSSPSLSALLGSNSESATRGSSVSHYADESQSEEQNIDRPLVEWVWRYFSGAHAPTQDMHRKSSGPRLTSSIIATARTFNCSGNGVSVETGPTCDENWRKETAGSSSVASAIATVESKTPPAHHPLLSSSPVHVTGLPPLYFQHAGAWNATQ